MIPNIENFYERIANEILHALPDSWQKAQVNAIFYGDSITWEPEYVTVAGELKSLDISMNLIRAFKELRRAFKDAGQPLWGQALFELEPSGKFNMKWGYDNCDEQGDTIWNEDEWRRRHEDRAKRLT